MNKYPVKLCECGCGNPSPIATGNHSKYGWIKNQPKRFIKGHWLLTQWTQSKEERFWDKVDKLTSHECWEWKAGKDQDGYGRFWHNGRSSPAHRFSYDLHNSRLPPRKMICHKCDTPSCVNPDHLFIGSPQENSQDMVNKNRSAKGELSGMSKLMDSDIIKIRKKYINGETQTSISREFNVHQTVVSSIILKKTWKHI